MGGTMASERQGSKDESERLEDLASPQVSPADEQGIKGGFDPQPDPPSRWQKVIPPPDPALPSAPTFDAPSR
jgi:hypothetical protein